MKGDTLRLRFIAARQWLPAPAVLSALLALWACGGGDRVAGGDDFPNSVSTLGRVAAEERADSTEWNAWKEAPATPPGVYDSTHVPDSVPEENGEEPMLRWAAEGIFLQLDSFVPGLDIAGALRVVDTIAPDPENGARRTVRVQSAALFTARDTTWSSLVNGVRVVRKVSGRLDLTNGGYRVFAFEDDDGDGVLAPRAGQANVARVRLSAADSSGRVEETLMRVSAGPNLDFNARGDNSLLHMQVVVRVGVDTLLARVLRPADGGLVIYDPLRDSNRVEVEEVKRLADGSLEELLYESVVFKDSTRNYPVRFRRIRTAASGKIVTTLLGRDSLAVFGPGDTGRVHTVFESTDLADSLQRAETVYRVKLADTAGRFADNLLLRVERHRMFRFGGRAETRYALVLSSPVPDGQAPRTGVIEMRIDFRPAGWIEFSGEATPLGYVGGWTNHQGRTGSASFDSLGGHIAPR